MTIEGIIDQLDRMAQHHEICGEIFAIDSLRESYKKSGQTLREAIALLKTHPEAQPNEPLGDGWIATKDRLPEPLEDVLVFYPFAPCGEPKVDVGIIYPAGDWMCESFYGPPTHWRPLPEPPKEGQE